MVKTNRPIYFAGVAVFLFGIGYIILYTFRPESVLPALLELIPGTLSVAGLIAVGVTRQDCFLQLTRISRRGAGLLALSLLFMPLIWLSGRWTGWNWTAALFYAPASGISQELFFRAASLPVLMKILPARPNLALVLQALFFALWHLPKAAISAPLAGLVGVILVTFICGILWGKQVQRDKTVFWMMGFHTLLLIGNSLFAW